MHALVLEDDMTDQDVAEEREDDDEGVSHGEQRLHGGVLGLGPVAPPAHKVLPVGEGVVAPEEVRGIGRGRGRRQARAVLPASGALRGPRQGGEKEEEAQRPAPDHFAGASATGNAPSGCPHRAAGGRAGDGRRAQGGPGRGPLGLSARPQLQPSIGARGAGAALLCPCAPGCEPAPPPIGPRGAGDALGSAAPPRLPHPARAPSIEARLPNALSPARGLLGPRSYKASSLAPGRVGMVSGTPQRWGLCSEASRSSDKNKPHGGGSLSPGGSGVKFNNEIDGRGSPGPFSDQTAAELRGWFSFHLLRPHVGGFASPGNSSKQNQRIRRDE